MLWGLFSIACSLVLKVNLVPEEIGYYGMVNLAFSIAYEFMIRRSSYLLITVAILFHFRRSVSQKEW